MRTHPALGVRLALVLAIGAGLAHAAPAQDPPFVDPTPAQWRADIAHLWEQLDEVHVDPFHHVSRDDLERAFDELSARVDGLQRHEVIVGIAQLVARLGLTDGHSELWIAPSNRRVGFSHLPLGIYRFEDGFYVQTARDDFAHLLGGKLITLGGKPVAEAFAAVATATSADNPSHARAYATLLMSVPEILHAVGVTASPDEASIVVENARGERVFELLPADEPQAHLYQWQLEPSLPAEGWTLARDIAQPTPLVLRAPEKPYWMEYEPENGLLYVQINLLRDQPDETLADFYARVFARAEEVDASALALDLRQNGGGSNKLNRPLIQRLIRSERFGERGSLFLLVGRHTFSAASHLVTYIESETKAILVGEPTGGSPNHYGDVAMVVLPNSRLSVNLSEYFWQNSLPWDQRPWTPPDVETPQTFANYRDGLDPAMEAVRSMIASERPPPEAHALRLDALFADFAATAGPGAALAVQRGDRLIHSRGYGLADLERATPIGPDTVFHAASVSKQFTAFAVFLLESEGRLSTDDHVLDWIPELTCAQGVRIRHLLDHTSGMRDQWQLLGLSGVRPNGDLISQSDVLELLYRQEELGFAPGSQQAYCNSGYTLLAEIVARAGGMPFPRFTRERIFEPLGMAHTSFQESPRTLISGRALSYGATAGGGYERIPIDFGTFGATGLMTTTEDLLRWARNAWELRVGTAPLYARMLERGRLDDGSELNFTGGLHVRTWRGEPMFGHPGSDAGYRSAILVVPEQRLAVALLGNVDTVDMWALPDRVLEILLGPDEPSDAEDAEEADEAASDGDPQDTPPSEPEPPPDLAELVGRYTSRELDTSYDLEFEGGSLHARHVRNGRLPLEWIAGDRFRCDRWYLNELAIERDSRGAAIAFRASSSRSRGVRFVRQPAPPRAR